MMLKDFLTLEGLNYIIKIHMHLEIVSRNRNSKLQVVENYLHS